MTGRSAGPDRRTALKVFTTFAASALLAGCTRTRARSIGSTSPGLSSSPPTRLAYGPDASQWGDLYVPAAPSHPGVIVIIHGGYWQAQYGADLGSPLAADLVRRGYTVWNLEYRRVHDGGGWPATFKDIAAGIDRLAEPAPVDLDLSRVVAVGHSAGGQLAVWAAGRPGLPAGSPGIDAKVRLTGVISQAGVLDLRRADALGLGGGAVSAFLAGSAAAAPERYRLADPVERVPIGVPVRCLHSATDGVVPIAQSSAYVAAAVAAGDDAELIRVPGDHFAQIDPASSAWSTARGLLPALLG